MQFGLAGIGPSWLLGWALSGLPLAVQGRGMGQLALLRQHLGLPSGQQASLGHLILTKRP